jgi:hypothetical protein
MEKRAAFCWMDINWPLHKAHPFGANPNDIIRTSPMYGVATSFSPG